MPAMTMTEKILARASGREQVKPGDLVLAKIDFVMGHDLTIPPSGKIMREQMAAAGGPISTATTKDTEEISKQSCALRCEC